MRLPAMLLAVLTVVASACARPPGVVGTGPFDELTVAEAQERDLSGARVRWGGEIVQATVEARETCFEVVDRPLDRYARPLAVDETAGRFIACVPGFHDPAVYAPGRAVTFVGTIAPCVVRKIGDYDYRYPQLRAENLHLWPKRAERELVYPSPWIYPYPGPFIGVWPYGRWYW